MTPTAYLADADAPPSDLCATLLEHALFYAHQGFPVFPCSAGNRWHGRDEKGPLTPHGYKDASTDAGQIRSWWSEHPGAMIGLPLGDVARGLVVLDLDVEKGGDAPPNETGGYVALEKAAAAGFAWPLTNGCVATPSGGLHMYFRSSESLPKASRKGADFQSTGAYVIAAPSRFDDGRAYEFIEFPNETGLGTTLADDLKSHGGLKSFFSDLDAIPRPPRWFGNPPDEFFPRKERAGCKTARPAVPPARSSGDDPFRALNDAALSNLGAWVRDLGLPKTTSKGSGFRAVASFRPSSSGRPLERRSANLSIHPAGIVDEGTSEPFTPINLVMAVFGIGQDAMMDAAKWLAERVGFDLADAMAPEPGPFIMLKTDAEKAREREEADVADAEPDALPVPALSDLEALCNPPGVVGNIIDWVVSTAERPSRAVALGPALGFVATLAGRLFASPGDLRTNLYIVTLAPSGYGKDRPREAIKKLAQAATLKNYLGGGRVMSTTALRNMLMRQPTCLCMVDEFHGMMRMMLDKRSPYSQLLSDDILQVFANAASYFQGQEYAGTPAADIYNPNFSLYGTSTQDAFWSSVNSISALDGLLARMMLFSIEGAKPTEVTPTASLRDVPPRLIEQCRAIASAGVGNLANRHDGAHGVDAAVVPYGAGAAERIRSFKKEIERWEDRRDARQDPFLNRAAEHAIKLALTVAVGCDPAKPVITGEIMDWACRLSWHSTCSMIAETQGRIADGQREADFNRLLGLIKRAGPEGITSGKIVDQTRNIDARRRGELLNDLQAAARIRFGAVQTKRGSRERYVFVR